MSDIDTPPIGLSLPGAIPTGIGTRTRSNWIEAVAQAWGVVLDDQTEQIVTASDKVAGGDSRPSAVADLSSKSQMLGLLTSAQKTSMEAIGEASQTLARKQ